MPTESRQVRRDRRFGEEFKTMPLWETWTDPLKKSIRTGPNDFRRIARQKRRAMARIKSKNNP